MIIPLLQLTTLALLSISVGAVPPPPAQVTADCVSPTYASDQVVCADDGLRELDHLLLERIGTENGVRSTAADLDSDEDWFRRSRRCAFEAEHRECLLAAYCLRLALLADADTKAIPACEVAASDYLAAHSFSRSGFARSGVDLSGLLGHEVLIWGYADHRNLLGDDRAAEILGDWWSGHGVDKNAWSFGLKADADDPAGHSFTVQVPNDLLRDDLLRLFLIDARAGRPTKVYLRGRISTFDAPMNFGSKTGLRMEVDSSRNVHPLRRPR